MLLKQLSNIKKIYFPRWWGCATRKVSPGEGGRGGSKEMKGFPEVLLQPPKKLCK